MKYNCNETIKQISGLNSLSTLKRWRKLAEELAGESFEEGIIPISRKSSTRSFLFTKEQIQKFQIVSNTKKELGLPKAILKAFSKNSELSKPINERIKTIEFILDDLENEAFSKINHLFQEKKKLKLFVDSLEKRIVQLENPPKRNVFGKKK